MKPNKTGHPLYTTSPDCNGLFTVFVWPGLVFFRATGKNQSSEVGSGKNQSEPDVGKQTGDRLVRPDFMYQTDTRKSLVFAFGTRFGLCQVIATSPPRWPLSRVLGRYGHVGELDGKARDRANVGLTWGWNTRHPIKVPHGAEA